MRPLAILIKQVVAGLAIVTKEHARPDAEQGKIIVHRTSGLHKISIPGATVIERYHDVLCSHGYISKELV